MTLFGLQHRLALKGGSSETTLQQLDAKPNHFTQSVVPFDQANCELKASGAAGW